MASRLVLTNALYLKASWAQPFAEDATTSDTFIRVDGSAIEASFMHKSARLAVARGAGWQVVELPYTGGTLALDVVVPDAGRFEEIALALEGGIAPFVMHL